MKRLAEARCAAGFHTNLVATTEGLNYRALVPTEAEWKRVPAEGKLLSRVAYCVLTTSGSQLTHQIHVKIK